MDLDELLDDITNSPQKKPVLQQKEPEPLDQPLAMAMHQEEENDWGEMETKPAVK